MTRPFRLSDPFHSQRIPNLRWRDEIECTCTYTFTLTRDLFVLPCHAMPSHTNQEIIALFFKVSHRLFYYFLLFYFISCEFDSFHHVICYHFLPTPKYDKRILVMRSIHLYFKARLFQRRRFLSSSSPNRSETPFFIHPMTPKWRKLTLVNWPIVLLWPVR